MDTIVIADRTFAALPVAVDVPGDVTHRDTRPVAGETDRERVTRLAARAVIEGVQLFAHPSQPTIYATSGTRHTLYALNPAALTCSCPATGICKHIAIFALSQGLVARLAPETLTCTETQARRACRPGRCGVDACYACKTSKATIALDAAEGTPFLCPTCALTFTRDDRFAAMSLDDRQYVIHQLNAAAQSVGSVNAA